MKLFITLLALIAATAEAHYAPAAVPVSTSVWPPYGVYGKGAVSAWPYAYNGWNNGWNTWNNAWNGAHGLYGAYPYAGAAWSQGPYYGHNTVVQANLEKSYPYGLPWGSYGSHGVHGWTGHHGGYLPTVVPVSKQLAATPGSVHVAAVPVGGEKLVVA